MKAFRPDRVYFEPHAREYPLGEHLYEVFRTEDIPVFQTTSHRQVRNIPGKTPREKFFEAKRTLVVGIRRNLQFQPSKPSADYMLPLVTGCPGHCHYCYLNTTLGPKPFIRVYVNLEEILERAAQYIEKRRPQRTSFDGSCTSDPVTVEPWTGALRHCVEYFARNQHGWFRLVTKYDSIETLLDIEHNGHTEVRFSLNSAYVVRRFEKGVPGIDRRIEAATRIAGAGYPLGFVIAPIMIYEGWRDEYDRLLKEIASALEGTRFRRLSFELIAHRFTPKAKRLISEVYPSNSLPMKETERKWKWGQFGYGKYIYRNDEYQALRDFFYSKIETLFPGAEILYLV